MNNDLTQTISQKLVDWYLANKRDLPWRHTKDPYRIWLSEIILQQTTIAQGLNYYLKFVKQYPTVHDLAQDQIDNILKLWQGLGYYSRARNLHTSAQIIVNRYGGVFPNTHKEILSLKGIGPYTAAAIMSFAFNKPYPVVDGNVIRFISRFFGIEKASDLPDTIKEIRAITDKLIIHQKPEVFNQAIMEIGALVCKPNKPHCIHCPFSANCYAFQKKVWDKIPFKSKKIKKRKRYFYLLDIIDAKGKTYIRKRTEKDIWQGLYQFPLIESDIPLDPSKNLFSDILCDYNSEQLGISKPFKQQLTHQTIISQFIKVKVSTDLNVHASFIITHSTALNKYPWPKTIDLYFNDLSITLF